MMRGQKNIKLIKLYLKLGGARARDPIRWRTEVVRVVAARNDVVRRTEVQLTA